MSNAWDDMKRAKENEYFERKNQEAMERMKQTRKTDAPRLSPITGEPMEQIVMHGVVVDRCKTSGGIWLDAGELEQMLGQIKESSGWLDAFSRSIGFGK